MKASLGMIEVIGYSTAVTIADIMVKVANVSVLDIKITNGGGWMSLFIEGDVAAVQAAIQAGTAEAKERQQFVSAKVIPRPSNQLEHFGLGEKAVPAETVSLEKAVVEEATPEVREEEALAVEKTEPTPAEKVQEEVEPTAIPAVEEVVKEKAKTTKKTKSRKK